MNILLIEDSSSDQVLFELYLKQTQLGSTHLVKTEYLKKGMELMSREEFDIVMLDLSLPDSFGIDGVKQLREKFPFKPIVVLTGLGESEMALLAIQAGAQDYLEKSELNPERLQQAIEYGLERSKLNKNDQEETIEELRAARNKLQAQQLELERALSTEKELRELRSSFVSEASHHFRTPLAVIQSNVELLLGFVETKDSGSFKKINHRIQLEISRITDIMDGLLKITHDGSNRECGATQIDILELCESMLDPNVNSQKGRRKLEKVVTGTPRRVLVMKEETNYALARLIENAFKYSKGEKNPQMSIDFSGSQVVSISIRDFGIGIPEADLNSIFQPFHRASNVGAIPGNGLGLAISNQYIRNQGGMISVVSNHEHTTFTIKLPDLKRTVEQDLPLNKT